MALSISLGLLSFSIVKCFATSSTQLGSVAHVYFLNNWGHVVFVFEWHVHHYSHINVTFEALKLLFLLYNGASGHCLRPLTLTSLCGQWPWGICVTLTFPFCGVHLGTQWKCFWVTEHVRWNLMHFACHEKHQCMWKPLWSCTCISHTIVHSTQLLSRLISTYLS